MKTAPLLPFIAVALVGATGQFNFQTIDPANPRFERTPKYAEYSKHGLDWPGLFGASWLRQRGETGEGED